MSIEYKIEWPEQDYKGGMIVFIRIEDAEHFWSTPVDVTKRNDSPAEISYGSGGHQRDQSDVDCAIAKSYALLAGAMIAKELDELYS